MQVIRAYRARRIVTLMGEKPARGRDLFQPLPAIDNGLIIVRNGSIESIGSYKSTSIPANCPVEDLGPQTVIPAPVNAHCHLQLSHFAGKTYWRRGFAAWLKSLIPLILAEKNTALSAQDPKITLACEEACKEAAQGAAHIGDIGGSRNGSLRLVRQSANKAGLGLTHFCEWFGFGEAKSPWPETCRDEVYEGCAPAGHALYSTSAKTLMAAREYCRKNKKVFSLHLAESFDETNQLLEGTGPLYELYRDAVLPENWRPPRMRPAKFAQSLNLFGPGFLAVHGVWLNIEEMDALAKSGSALCLCPRSNKNLAVGKANIAQLIKSNILLCLGTDGLTSNTDVNVLNEARFLSAELPEEALIRMLTINGAAALGLSNLGRLYKGAPAKFRVWAL